MASSHAGEKPKRNIMDVLGKHGTLSTKSDESSQLSKRNKPPYKEPGWTDLGQGCRIGMILYALSRRNVLLTAIHAPNFPQGEPGASWVRCAGFWPRLVPQRQHDECFQARSST